MSTSKDHPGVIAFPPLLWLIGAVVSVLVHLLVAWRITHSHIALFLGIALALAAPSLAYSALRVMRAAGTNIDPAKPALVIARNVPTVSRATRCISRFACYRSLSAFS